MLALPEGFGNHSSDAVDAVKKGGQVDRERRDFAVRLPHERLDQPFDRRIVGTSAFHVRSSVSMIQ